MNSDNLTVKAPAKIILSGEHAVVHGFPALAVAVNRYTQTTVRWTTPLHFSFNLMGIDFRNHITLQALKKLKRKLQKQYQDYHSGKLPIRQVLQHPFELSLFTVVNVLDRIKNKLPTGLDVVTETDIPIGCGMGSSASSVVSLIYALTHFLQQKLDISTYIQLGIESENLQHGYSSGLDVNIVYHGGCIRYEKSKLAPRHIPKLALQLIQTGQPQSTTGDCVSACQQYFKNTPIGLEFAAVTHSFDSALQQNNKKDIQYCIRENHRLLQRIGVIPAKVSAFIEKVENRGGAAKVCGAGTVEGDNAGVVVALVEQPIDDLTSDFGYQLMNIEIDHQGTHVI